MREPTLDEIVAQLKAHGVDVRGVMTLEEAQRYLAEVIANERNGQSGGRHIAGAGRCSSECTSH